MADTTTGAGFSLVGAAAKGPLVLGSTVSVAVLDPEGNPTGVVFMTLTNSDLGEFEVDVDDGVLVSVEAEGFHFNEVVGDLSTSTVTLRAYYESTGAGQQEASVNVVTRLRFLPGDGA